MLVDVPLLREHSKLLSAISSLQGFQGAPKKLRDGAYQIGHWNFELETSVRLDPWPDGPPTPFGSTGICDYPDQVFEKCPELLTSPRKYVVSFVQILKEGQDPLGGWRWHKWGEYIGDKTPTTEYLHDEPEISEVLTFNIHEVLNH